MFSSFRTRLILIVGTAMVTLLVIIGSALLIGVRQTRSLETIEKQLLPKLELGPRLEASFEHLRLTLQDAVAAQDVAGLAAVTSAKDEMFGLIARGSGALGPNEAAALRWSISEYAESGIDVSRRLIAGETGELIVADMAHMQAKQAKTSELIKKLTRLRPSELSDAFASIHAENQRVVLLRLALALGALVLVALLSVRTARRLLLSVANISSGFTRFAKGDFASRIPVESDDEFGKLAREANQMASSLEDLGARRDRDDWLKAGLAGLSDELRGELEPDEVTQRSLGFLAGRVQAAVAALYVSDEQGVLRLASQYAGGVAASSGDAVASFAAGEGLIGQAALSDEIKVIEPCPEGYLKVRSGLGQATPRSLLIVPFSHLGKALGVAEFGLLESCSEEARELMNAVRQIVIATLEASRSRVAKAQLLERAQDQAQRLAAQEEELRVNNQELLAQQERLQGANEELEAQRSALRAQNTELDEARRGLQLKMEELAQVSTYKSQFLANMSHELRTPLNSMLLLSHLLTENEGKNLTAKQVEHCRTIHSAGQDLLLLINEVLDLSKIEAGREDVETSTVTLEHFKDYARRVFEPMAADKGLHLRVEILPGAPSSITTDVRRVERIVTNLIGNAIKFTDNGEVRFSMGRPAPGTQLERGPTPERLLAFSVTDTGIGIPREARERIFAPFEQIEAQTSRRYSGTGLGLTIARASAELLGGELRVESTPGEGSTFVCYLPDRSARDTARAQAASLAAPAADDRGTLGAGDVHLLVIEDDATFAEQLVQTIHSRHMKALVASTAEEGLMLARKRRPHGIILDVNLPDLDGWTVMERLRHDPVTSAIPVHFVSGVDAPERGLALGAVGYLTKPASRKDLLGVVRRLVPRASGASKRVLVVEDVASEGESLVAFLRRENFEAEHVTTAGAALNALQTDQYGCMILDLGLPDVDGLSFLETLKDRRDFVAPNVVVHTGRALTKKETRSLEAYAEAVVLKDGRSAERLLEELRLFVRQLQESLPVPSTPLPRGIEVSLSGARILLAEDDMRTVYALSALLRSKGAEVFVGETGSEALELLEQHPDVQCVLMDVMMPEMDGYTAMRKLRADPRFSELPVIALTAKAMKGERERCMEAGASDYLSKPVDNQRLLETVQRWWRQRVDDDNAA
jgi:CheY-like chemotaxis protein/HAMP domain-containing protein